MIIFFSFNFVFFEVATATNLKQSGGENQYNNTINILEKKLNNPNYRYSPVELADIYVYMGIVKIQVGKYNEAKINLEQAIKIYQEIQNEAVTIKLVAAFTDLAHINLLIGKTEVTLALVESTLKLIQNNSLNENFLLIKEKAYRLKGKAFLIKENYNQAFQAYWESLKIAQSLENQDLEARIHLNLSEAHLAQHNAALLDADFSEQEGWLKQAKSEKQFAARELKNALEEAEKAYELDSGNNLLLTTQIQEHLLKLNSDKANLNQAVAKVLTMPNSVQKAEILRKLSDYSNNPKSLLEKAIAVSKQIGDNRGVAKGNLAISKLIIKKEKYSLALDLTQNAILAASEILAEDVLYEAWFTSAKLNTLLGNYDNALSDYRRAINSLLSLRGTTGDSLIFRLDFKTQIEPIYRGYLELLLSNPIEKNLREAIEVFELLQLSDLEDFFGDRCIEQNPNNPQPDLILQQTNSVALYAISLKESLHIIFLSSDGSINHTSTDITASDLDKMLKQWRYDLTDYSTHRYLDTSIQLYDKMIRPFSDQLEAINPTTIVFIGDRFFRNVPLDALRDRLENKFLIEKYAIATTLGLKLTDFTTSSLRDKSSLIFALTIDKPPFGKLKYATKEVESVTRIVPDTEKFLDSEFTKKRFAQEMKTNQELSNVHLITHGKFAGTKERTYLLTYEDTISILELENMLKQGNFSINMIVLSACQTATGNERAILGLAGVTVRGGSKSTLGSLWFVNDLETSKLISYFYENLYQHNSSKAEALQKAKIRLIYENPNFSHPLMWSSFLILGNWQ